jgi:hypothetical protein
LLLQDAGEFVNGQAWVALVHYHQLSGKVPEHCGHAQILPVVIKRAEQFVAIIKGCDAAA